MSDREAFRYILQQLQEINGAIRLQLPASPSTLHLQALQLVQTKHQLAQLRQQVLKQFRDNGRMATHRTRRMLLRLIHYSQRQADNYRILSEEFAVDPQGSLACLEAVQQRNQRLLKHLKTLETRANVLTSQIAG